jgi:aminoglycoside phosphotransferase (APT) family kinase protein
VLRALARAGLEPVPVSSLRAGTLGTFPTYLTGTGLVVKLFGRAFDGAACLDAEVRANALVAGTDLPVPAVLASGELYDDGDWRWPFLVFEEAHGVPLRTALPSLSPAARETMATGVGSFLRRLHDLPVPADATWDAFLDLVDRRRTEAPTQIGERGHAAPHLVAELPSYLARFPTAALFDASARPVLVHGDVHADHVFVDPGTGEVLAVIDWGDAWFGDWRYDLTAVHAGSFFADRDLLAACLDAYGAWPDPHEQLAVMLLHEFDPFTELPQELLAASSLDELAVRLWCDPRSGR